MILKQKTHNRALEGKVERGFSLLVVLLITIAFALIVVFLSDADRRATREKRAESVAWQVKQIAKAARLYVRNNSIQKTRIDTNADGITDLLVDTDAAFTANAVDLTGDGILDNRYDKIDLDPDGATGPQTITVTDLINAGYLPASFSYTDVEGNDTTEQTILGQPITIYVANSPIDSADPSAANVVATAYVVLEDSAKVDANDAAVIARAIQEINIPVAAPLYSGGTNLSEDCAGSPAVAAWNTGCMNDDDFDLLTGNVVGSGTFAAGSLVIPAWKAAEQDERVVMRYPQPENDTYATMLTSLWMALPEDTDGTNDGVCNNVADQVFFNTDDDINPTISSNLCNTQSDDNTVVSFANDNRRDILNAGNLTLNRVIATAQRNGGVAQDISIVLNGTAGGVQSATERYGSITDNRDLDINGDNNDDDDVVAIGGNLTVDGQTKIFDDAGFAYASADEKAYLNSALTAQGSVSSTRADAVGSGFATAFITGSVNMDGDSSEVAVRELNAPNAFVNIGFAEGTIVNGAPLTAAQARAEAQTSIQLDTLDLPAGVRVDGTYAALDNIGITTERFDPGNNTINADRAIFFQGIRGTQLVVNGGFNPAGVGDPDISTVTGLVTNQGTDTLNVNDITADDTIRVFGNSSYTGQVNVSDGTGSATCSGDCPVVESYSLPGS